MNLKQLEATLRGLEERDLLRVPDGGEERARLAARWGRDFVDASSNDYLGLGRTVSRETRPEVPTGSGASRLIFGTHPQHQEVEDGVAEWLGYPASLLFSSGYAANVGSLSCLLSPGDAVFSDRLNHASLIDGIRLSGARPQVFEHLDLYDLEEQLRRSAEAPARWVVVESYYSMDGDGPDLKSLRELCDRHDATLFVDEAHALGVFGEGGGGALEEAGVHAEVVVAAFGKAVGSQGACVLGSPALRVWLWNRARSFVFSTAPSPVATATLAQQIQRCREAQTLRQQLARRCQQVRNRLDAAGLPLISGSRGPIVSLLLGEEPVALSFARNLRERGILCQAIRPPSVPVGSARVRLTLHANWTDRQEESFTENLLACWRDERQP